MRVAAQAAASQDPGIRRSPDSFDAIPASVNARTDLYPGAKRLYGLLRSVQNMQAEPSYADLAAALGASVRSIVRWMAQLVEKGLITLWRRGLGMTNIATVGGLAVRSAMESRQRVPIRRQDARSGWRPNKTGNNSRRNVPVSYAQGRLGAVPAR